MVIGQQRNGDTKYIHRFRIGDTVAGLGLRARQSSCDIAEPNNNVHSIRGVGLDCAAGSCAESRSRRLETASRHAGCRVVHSRCRPARRVAVHAQHYWRPATRDARVTWRVTPLGPVARSATRYSGQRDAWQPRGINSTRQSDEIESDRCARCHGAFNGRRASGTRGHARCDAT